MGAFACRCSRHTGLVSHRTAHNRDGGGLVSHGFVAARRAAHEQAPRCVRARGLRTCRARATSRRSDARTTSRRSDARATSRQSGRHCSSPQRRAEEPRLNLSLDQLLRQSPPQSPPKRTFGSRQRVPARKHGARAFSPCRIMIRASYSAMEVHGTSNREWRERRGCTKHCVGTGDYPGHRRIA